MGRAPCCDKATVKRGPWSPEEDAKLKAYIEQHGTCGNWIALPQKIGLNRCGKSCRLRWLNYLRPNIKHGGFSEEEDNIICSLYITIGSRWSIIAAQLPGRTDNDIKNYWNTKLKKKLLGKQRQDQRARPARCLKQEIKRKGENLLITRGIDAYPPLQEAVPMPAVYSNEETHYKDQTFIESFIVKLGGTFHTGNYEQLSNIRNNHYFRSPSDISCALDQLFENSITMHASSVSVNITNGTCSPPTSGCYPINWVGANSFQVYNNAPGQRDELPYTVNSQHFDGLESYSVVDMVNSCIITSPSPESASWKDTSSLVYPSATASNLELCQELVPENCTFGSSGYMNLKQTYFTSIV